MITKQRKGFTLIELMIVLALVGIVAAVVIPLFYNLIKYKDSAPDPLATTYPVAVSGNWDDDLRKNLKVVCLDGFLYYYSREGSSALNSYGDESRAIFAPKFNNDLGANYGFPMPCPKEAPVKEKP